MSAEKEQTSPALKRARTDQNRLADILAKWEAEAGPPMIIPMADLSDPGTPPVPSPSDEPSEEEDPLPPTQPYEAPTPSPNIPKERTDPPDEPTSSTSSPTTTIRLLGLMPCDLLQKQIHLFATPSGKLKWLLAGRLTYKVISSCDGQELLRRCRECFQVYGSKHAVVPVRRPVTIVESATRRAYLIPLRNSDPSMKVAKVLGRTFSRSRKLLDPAHRYTHSFSTFPFLPLDIQDSFPPILRRLAASRPADG